MDHFVDDMASLNLVYTHPDYRRKHYAENMSLLFTASEPQCA